jgi:ureidoacrylate peracid hydrolase
MHKIHIPDHVKQRVIARQGRLQAIETLDPAKTALLVVDMQNYFMADGELGCCPVARDIVPNVNRLAQTVRDTGGRVVWIQNAAPEETLKSWANLHELYSDENRKTRLEGLTPGSNGHALWGELEVGSEDHHVEKTRYSAFIRGASGIEEQLRNKGIDTVIVTGVATNVCCESTARDAMMLGFRTIMVADANAAPSDAEHNATLASFMLFFGDVQNTEEIIAKLRQAVSSEAAE